MKYIVYVSQASKPFANEALAKLLSHSRARNARDAITGCLVYRYNADYGRGNFLQVLEGPEDAIDDVWRRICADKRHHTLITINEGKIGERMFSNWSMGFKNVDAEDLKDAEGFADLGTDAFWQRATRGSLPNALELLKGFYDS